MTADMLTLREVAEILKVSAVRIYQLDDELQPVKTCRGSSMVTRHYDRASVEAYRARRADESRASVELRSTQGERAAWRQFLRQAEREEALVMLTIQEAAYLATDQCAFCGAGEAPHRLTRLAESRAYSTTNAVAICDECRAARGARSSRDFVKHALRVARHPQLWPSDS